MFCFAFTIILLVLLAKWVLASSSNPSQTDDDPDQELCIKCKYDVRGLETCPECGTKTRAARRNALMKLRDDWPSESIAPRTAGPDENPVVILTTKEGLAIGLLRQHLEARGIHAKTSSSRDHRDALGNAHASFHRLTVWSADEERARVIVDHLWPVDARS